MTERRLPVKQLVILSICRFAEPLALTSVLPYIPEMIESFGIPQNDIAWWAGFTAASFSLAQAAMGIPWGVAADRFGRKPAILLGLVNTMITMLIWGFSTSLPMAIAARALQGLGNGNVGILRTMVAELCPWKELQPRAFSIMPIVFGIGAVFGPTLGGVLSNPLNQDPLKPRGDRFLERYPYLLPNIVSACIFAIGIVTGWLFLHETLETKKNERDYGLVIGAKLTAWVRKTYYLWRPRTKEEPERESLLAHHKPHHDEETGNDISSIMVERQVAPGMREVLTFQTTLNLVVYTMLALYSLAYDQLLPVFWHHPPQSIDDPNVSLPFKFAGGFGLGPRHIGAIFTFYSVSSTTVQFVAFPRVARYLGVLRCLRIAFLIFPVVFFVTPFISLLPEPFRQIAMVMLLMIRGVAGTFAFPTSTIMITNSAGNLRFLGTINGIATSVSAIGRAVGPALGGSLFTLGVKRGYVLVPFWALSAIAALACIPIWWLEEGKGFGDDPDSDEESVLSASAASISSTEDDDDGRKATGQDDDDPLSESEYGEPTGLLSRTTTRSGDEETDGTEEGGTQPGRRDRRNSMGHVRSHSHGSRRTPVRRRTSVPIGMGLGFRRLSSNLGSTGVGAGGASWGGA
ncbi:major facilitator superfamily domain-containing protein [Massariosphaeria phaeospora]|uniref:Major facilitator superfamily domain-containing protein n=1 Tax=Massariosphaeria phaeospora TaxID=100035 RepID=A0A7C8IEP4_9PLEO|nr:major facilitator superfamily domain-containing protein [Massariosphaeria phaeospora]